MFALETCKKQDVHVCSAQLWGLFSIQLLGVGGRTSPVPLCVCGRVGVWGGHGTLTEISGKHTVCFFHRNSFTVVLHIRYLTERTNLTCLRTKLLWCYFTSIEQLRVNCVPHMNWYQAQGKHCSKWAGPSQGAHKSSRSVSQEILFWLMTRLWEIQTFSKWKGTYIFLEEI